MKNTASLTAQIVSAYASNNRVAVDDLSKIISAVHASLREISRPSVALASQPQPVVPLHLSKSPDHLICLACGLKFQMLKSHLSKSHHLTPEAYRKQYGLGENYPMVASNYAKKRSKIAKTVGLGTMRKCRGADKL